MHLDRPSLVASLFFSSFKCGDGHQPRTSSNRFDLKAMGNCHDEAIVEAFPYPNSVDVDVPGTFPTGETRRKWWTFWIRWLFLAQNGEVPKKPQVHMLVLLVLPKVESREPLREPEPECRLRWYEMVLSTWWFWWVPWLWTSMNHGNLGL